MPQKICFKCKLPKDLESEFFRCRSRGDGRGAWCKDCTVKYNKARRKADPEGTSEHSRWYFLGWKYGMTREQYERMFEAQGGCCAICRIPDAQANRPGKQRNSQSSRGLCVDHDHQTGVVRGLLCNTCNRAIGYLKDSPEVLLRAMLYLQAARAGSCDALTDGAGV